MISGMTVYLLTTKQVGVNAFNEPIYSEIEEPVDNVLVGEPTADDITTTLNLYGKKIAYTLAIPKGDTHDWEDARIRIWGELYHTIGFPTQGIEANIPLSWNKKVKVERNG